MNLLIGPFGSSITMAKLFALSGTSLIIKGGGMFSPFEANLSGMASPFLNAGLITFKSFSPFNSKNKLVIFKSNLCFLF